MSEFTCPKCGASLIVAARNNEPKKTLSFNEVKALFPAELDRLVTYEQKDSYTIVRPKRFLGTEVFAKVAHIVRANGGNYISDAKNSHFRI